MANLKIRTTMRKADVRQWEVADSLGISEFTLTRWLRKELSSEQEVLVFQAIRTATAQKFGESEHERSKP